MKKFLAILLGAAGLNAYAHNCGGQIAIKQCEADGATNCKIVMPEGCSIPDGMYD
ncbi:hypothetical protein [Glaesserella sp.]|uniref:hypothetical protein n=1 Tax=Glaesserella sp. TaxID=2094731 RepID=UPI0035A06777